MQIVGYDTESGDVDAALLVADDGDLSRTPLTPGTELRYTLEERHCAGAIEDGRHADCGNERAPYCRDHASTWVCARCTGTCLKPEMDCHEEHAVYLAAFAPATFKVGVTRRERLRTRLREQGADRAAHVRTVSNGRIARQIEADTADREEVSDRVRVPAKIRGLHRNVEAAAWRDLLTPFDPIDVFEFDYGLELSDRPVRETLAAGTVGGVKGRVLVLERAGGTYAVDLRDLVGYEVTEGTTDRELQSSLGAFG